MVADIFLIILFFLLVNGLFSVSAGAYNKKQLMQIIDITNLKVKLSVKFNNKYGTPIINIEDMSKQVIEFFAWKPNPGNRKILNKIVLNINSFQIPRQKAMIFSIIILEKLR